jgi:pimeloyl-ACP methyl ester carboxylesterase
MHRRFQKLVLRDGRSLSWREYGAGFPVIFTHGNLNSSLFSPSWSKTTDDAMSSGAKIFAVDRPGYGNSSIHDGRTYQDWTEDVRQLVAHLGLERYSVVGFSSGGPHALSCYASRLPGYVHPPLNSISFCVVIIFFLNLLKSFLFFLLSSFSCLPRLSSCTLVSSDAPYHHLNLVQTMYGTDRVSMETALKSAKVNKERMMESYLNMKNKDRVSMAVSDLEHATLSGYHGAASDSVLEASTTWGKEMDQYFEGEFEAEEKVEKKKKKQESSPSLAVAWNGGSRRAHCCR